MPVKTEKAAVSGLKIVPCVDQVQLVIRARGGARTQRHEASLKHLGPWPLRHNRICVGQGNGGRGGRSAGEPDIFCHPRSGQNWNRV